VFRPRPRVDSTLVAFERAPTAAIADVRPIVEAAFAHRRKTLPNSVSVAGLAPRASVEEALDSIGIPIAARAEELEPPVFVQLAALLR
jgi:16S rRNA (adenine1518-N6/adenine1519-N6)-dimethyltransferase